MKTNKRIKFLALLALAAALPASASMTTVYDFNDGNNLGWVNVPSDSGNLFWDSNGGLGNSGAITRTGSGGRQEYISTESTFDGSLGELSMSLFFVAGRPDSDEPADRSSQIGFHTDQITGNPRSVTGDTDTFDRLDQDGQANNVFVTMRPRNNVELILDVGASDATGSSSIETSANVAVTEGNWYFWENTFVSTGNDTWQITSSIFEADNAGNIGTELLSFTNSSDLSGPDLTNFENVYGIIGMGQENPGNRDTIRTIDNVTITAIPEPGTLLLLGFALAWLRFIRRRR